MKSEKHYIFWKKVNFFIIKILLWGTIGFIYANISVLIPTESDTYTKELIVFFCLVLVVSLHTSYLYPVLYKKRRWVYNVIFLFSILGCSGLEMFIFYENFNVCFYVFPNMKEIYLITFLYILIRNFSIFIFFLWVEYSNRMILLYYKSEKIHREELSLLKEKQTFEKNYIRKSLLPHYFFNILEHIYAKSLSNKKDRELIDKLKFILHYFLVDAEKERVELDKEILYYHYYIELEKFRHKKNIDIHFNIIGSTDNYFILPLLFEPIIGNAMKYTQQDGSGRVDICVDTTHFSSLTFACKNTCLPYNSNIVSSENGLKILKQRLEFCYKNKHSLKINQSADFFEVILDIILEKPS